MEIGNEPTNSRMQRYRALMIWRTIASGALLCGTTAFVLAGMAPARLDAQQAATASLVLEGVAIVDVEHGKIVPGQRVVVTGNRITAVGGASTVKMPKDAQIVDASGKYLIPGLWDMHVHVNASRWFDDVAAQDSLYRERYPRFIAHGVTGIREMGQRFQNGAASFRIWRREVMAGTLVGPRAIGPSADVSDEGRLPLESPERAIRVIDSLKAAGDAFVKSHEEPNDRSVFFAMMREARRVGLPVVGHVPPSVTEVEAVDSGMHSIEHIRGGGPRDCWPHSQSADSVALEKACTPVAEAYVRNGTWFTPTLVTMLILSADRQSFANMLRYLRTMHRLGVTKILAGSDLILASMEREPEFLPGLSSAEELLFLVEAGLTPVEALQAATLNPAKFLNATDSLGTVAAGKLADLVLLDANPLADITNVLKLRAVVANGRYFDRSALDALDPAGTRPGNGMLMVERRLNRKTGAGPNP